MHFKNFVKICTWSGLGLAIVCLLVFISLPRIAEVQIEKRLPQFLNSSTIEFHIQNIGFFNTFVSRIRVSKGISIDSVNIDYHIKKLSSILLKKVTISGLTVHATLDENNQIKIPGLEFPKVTKGQNRQSDRSFLPFLPEKIVFKNARLILDVLGEEFLIPFDVLSFINSKDGKIVANTFLYPFGEKINTLVTYDINKGLESLKIEGKFFDSAHINPYILRKTAGVQLKGPVDFTLETSSPQKKWNINISQLGFVHPVEASLKDLSTILLIDNQTISASGAFNISGPILPATRMEYDLTLDLKNQCHFDLKLKNTTADACKIVYESNIAILKNPRFSARFNGTPLKSKGKITLAVKQGRIQYQKEAFRFGGTKINSDITLDFTGHGNGLKSKWALSANNIHIKSALMDSNFLVAGISGWFLFDKTNSPSFGMTLKASGGEIISPEFKTRASGINIEIPFRYPNPGNNVYGTYSIPTISYDNRYIFSTSGKLLQTGLKKFLVSGKAAFKTLPDLKARFKSSIGFKKGVFVSLDFKTDPVKLSDADMVKLAGPVFQNADIDVTASARGKARYLDHRFKTFLHLDLSDGKILVPDMNFTATGINTMVDFNDLLAPRSAPGQILTIDSIKVNKIKINNTKVRFSIEDAKSLLIENIRFKWCDGLVSTESIRIPQDNNVYSLILYCDRLDLARLLKQLGAFHAEGKGTLNGRIPVMYSNGNISFKNGFLFSTPGSGGKVVIENTDMITAGIPIDTPQFSQLDLAREALKDFDYKWAKLVFNTFEDTLYVNMELDGKPARFLPFEYKKEFGGFIRVDASSPGSHFQGIKLDVNLKLPFNEVMKFGNKLKSIFN